MRQKLTAMAALAGLRLLLALLLLLGVARESPGAEPADRQTVGDLTAYLALVPSRIIDDDRHRQAVKEMHGGVPNWGNSYHVVASVFDAENGQRLEHVEVRAIVFSRESRLPGPKKRLEPMIMNGRKTWGNFFSLPAADPFRIRLEIKRQPDGPVATMDFRYEQHPHRERPAT